MKTHIFENWEVDNPLNIKTLREQAGMTQAELAERANVDQSAVSRWEIGNTKPRRRQIPIIAKALGVTVEELLKPAGSDV